MSDQELADLLAEPFEAGEVRWKPQAVKGNRALAVVYIDARLVMDRLDEVFGVGGWQDEYTPLGNGSVLCRLSCRFGDRWVTKTDVGGESEQPDEHDRTKAAFSDALKRVAVKFGIGRYLYRVGNVWADYDPARKQFTAPPRLPPWALPKPRTHAAKLPPAPYADPAPPPPADEKALPAAKAAKYACVADLAAATLKAVAPADAGTLRQYVGGVAGELAKLGAKPKAEFEADLKAFLKVPAGEPVPYDRLHPPQIESGWNWVRQQVMQLADAEAAKAQPKE